MNHNHPNRNLGNKSQKMTANTSKCNFGQNNETKLYHWDSWTQFSKQCVKSVPLGFLNTILKTMSQNCTIGILEHEPQKMIGNTSK